LLKIKTIKKTLLRSENLNYLAIMLFAVLSFILISNHEPYRDEAVQWLKARDSQNLSSFLKLLGYGGHIGLWPFILFLLTKLGLPYFSMSLVHSLLMLTAVVVFVRYAPFSRLQKLLFIFGYYPFYEYNAIARSYVLSVLFLFLIAVMHEKRFTKPVLYSFLIFLLANTNVHTLVIALVLSTVYVFELINKNILNTTLHDKLAISIVILGISLAVFQLWPHQDQNPDTVVWNFELTATHFSVLPRSILGAFLPIPRLRLTFWAPKLVSYSLSELLILAVPLFFLSSVFLIKKTKPLLIYLFSCFGLFSLFFLKYPQYPGGLRHHGLIFIVFIFSLWIATDYKDELQVKFRLINRLFRKRVLTVLFTGLLSIHAAVSPVVFYYDLNYDFSAGKKTAYFLIKNGYINEHTFIATYWSPFKTSILPYIRKPYSKFYFVGYQDFRSFIIGNTDYTKSKNLTIDEVVDRIDRATRGKHYTTTLLILGKRMVEKGVDINKKFNEKYQLIAYFDKTIVDEESLYIYKLKD